MMGGRNNVSFASASGLEVSRRQKRICNVCASGIATSSFPHFFAKA
jgi:hypothetical protein